LAVHYGEILAAQQGADRPGAGVSITETPAPAPRYRPITDR